MLSSLIKSAKWYTLAGVVLFLFLYVFGGVVYTNNTAFWIDIVLTISTTLFLSLSQTAFFNLLSDRLHYENGPIKRIITLLVLLSITVAVSMTMIVVVVHYLIFEPNPQLCNQYKSLGEAVRSNVGIALVANVVILLSVEAIYLFKNWKKSLVKAETLEKQKMAAELNALKSQINPHFLFNSLNTLNSIMQVSVPQAEVFIQRFSSLYRYVLTVNDKTFVSLTNELKLAEDYFFLQQERFGKAVKIEFNTPEHFKFHLPPLCLHELLENAIKHNKFGLENPLIVSVKIMDGFLIVKNTYSPLKKSTESTSIGQANILKRYELLNMIIPQFQIENDCYIVKLQLLKQ